jgi:phenol 2-monooxygenase
MARKPEEISDPQELANFYLATSEFPSGFMTQYPPSMIVGDASHHDLATGFPIGKRFKSAQAVRVCDGNVEHIGHRHLADGRWRIYAFADRPSQGEASALADWAQWMATSPESPVVRYARAGADADAVLDVTVTYQQDFAAVDVTRAPEVFRPRCGALALRNWEKVYAAGIGTDIFAERGLSRDGVVVVVRPDQYVAAVLPLAATDELAAFFARNLVPAA